MLVFAISGMAEADIAPPSQLNPEPCNLDNHPDSQTSWCDCLATDQVCARICRLASRGECVTCWLSSRARPEGCAETYQRQGYSRMCKTAETTVWREIWCREAKPDASPPAPPSSLANVASPPATIPASPSSPTSDPTAACSAVVPPASSAVPPPPAAPAGPNPVTKPGACGACTVGAPWGRFSVAAASLLIAALAALRARRG
jgi:hypothetical protein